MITYQPVLNTEKTSWKQRNGLQKWGKKYYNGARTIYKQVCLISAAMMSWVWWRVEFILFAENSQILHKTSNIPVLLTFMYLVVALNLLVNNQPTHCRTQLIIAAEIRHKGLSSGIVWKIWEDYFSLKSWGGLNCNVLKF